MTKEYEQLDRVTVVDHRRLPLISDDELTLRAVLSLVREPYGAILGEIRRYTASHGQFFFGDAVRRLPSPGNYSDWKAHLLLSEMRTRGLISQVL